MFKFKSVFRIETDFIYVELETKVFYNSFDLCSDFRQKFTNVDKIGCFKMFNMITTAL